MASSRMFLFLNTYTDESGLLFLRYMPDMLYYCEVIWDSNYEQMELFVNGDPVQLSDALPENKSYRFSFSFTEKPANVFISAIGERKQVSPGLFDDEKSTDEQDILLVTSEIESLRQEIARLQEIIYNSHEEDKNSEVIQKGGDYIYDNSESICIAASIAEMQLSIMSLQMQVDSLDEKLDQLLIQLSPEEDTPKPSLIVFQASPESRVAATFDMVCSHHYMQHWIDNLKTVLGIRDRRFAE